MKILFGYVNSTGSWDMPLGIAYLSAMCKKHGHETSLLDQTFLGDLPPPASDFDVFALSCTTLEYQTALIIAQGIKKFWPHVPIIFGGCKATIEPEQVFSNPYVDAVCIGEGEYPLINWLRSYERRRSVEIANKETHGFFPNIIPPLVENLDELPFPDRSIFDRRHIENKYPGTTFLTSRGCPFRCSMCINHYLAELYRGKGKYTRFRSVDNIFHEILEVSKTYNVSKVFFVDDTFTINKKRLYEFLERYPKEIRIPFMIMGRCNTVSSDMMVRLREAGCVYIGFGVESGNPAIRNNILKRNMTNKQIWRAFRSANLLGIHTASYNMIGIPSETREEMFDTIKLNKKIKPSIVQVAQLYPFPKTQIRSYAEKHNLLKPEEGLDNYYTDSIVKIEGMNNKQLYALQTVFPFYVYGSRLLWPLFRLGEWILSHTTSKFLRRVASWIRKKTYERNFWRQIKK